MDKYCTGEAVDIKFEFQIWGCSIGYVEMPDNVQRSFGAKKWSEKTKMIKKIPKSKTRSICENSFL